MTPEFPSKEGDASAPAPVENDVARVQHHGVNLLDAAPLLPKDSHPSQPPDGALDFSLHVDPRPGGKALLDERRSAAGGSGRTGDVGEKPDAEKGISPLRDVHPVPGGPARPPNAEVDRENLHPLERGGRPSRREGQALGASGKRGQGDRGYHRRVRQRLPVRGADPPCLEVDPGDPDSGTQPLPEGARKTPRESADPAAGRVVERGVVPEPLPDLPPGAGKKILEARDGNRPAGPVVPEP